MNPIITLLIYAGIPLAVVVVVAALVYGGGHRHTPRYRPGRPFECAPVWFLAAPDKTAARAQHHERPQVEAARRSEQRSVGGARVPAIDAPLAHGGAKGGARGTW